MRINSGGHTWPGSSLPGVGNTNQDISANQEMWNFCSQFTIPESVRCAAPENLTATPSSGPGSVYLFNWDENEEAEFYTFALITESDSVLFTDSLSSASFSAEVPLPTDYRWSVAAHCKSGYVAWAKVNSVQSISTGIKDRVQSSLKIYPNPSQNTITISGFKNETLNELSIFDIQGRWYQSRLIATGNNIQADISALSPGTYFVKMGAYSGSFVKLP